MERRFKGLNAHDKQSALIDAILSDNLDVIMIQDSRLKSKDDVLHPIKVPECHTYFKPLSATYHGLLTIVNIRLPSAKHPTPVHDDGTEALSVKVCLQGKPVIMHNIYRVKDSVNLTSILSSSTPSFIAGDFNAHHTLWCKKTDRAGRELLAQIEDNQQYVIKNELQTLTTKYNTTIDLTIVHTTIASTCSWSIYDTLKSDHYAVLATLNTGKILPPTTSVRK